MSYVVEAIEVSEWRWVVQIRTPKDKIYHSRPMMVRSMAEKEARKCQDVLDKGRKLPTRELFKLRPTRRDEAGKTYDLGYAICRACDKILVGYDYSYGGEAIHPTTGQVCPKNEFGGHVCDAECDAEASNSMKGSMPGAGRA